MPAPLDLAKRRFGRLVVIERHPDRRGDKVQWVCKCDCGCEVLATTQHLRYGAVKSCGCLMEGRKHGRVGTAAYGSWYAMIQRCENPNHISASNYSGRGIKVCKEWHNFKSFYSDMGDPPPNFTLDRRDNNGNYTPDNCRWASPTTQARNARSNKLDIVAAKYIRELSSIGLSQVMIAKAYGVSTSSIGHIVNHQSWKENV